MPHGSGELPLRVGDSPVVKPMPSSEELDRLFGPAELPRRLDGRQPFSEAEANNKPLSLSKLDESAEQLADLIDGAARKSLQSFVLRSLVILWLVDRDGEIWFAYEEYLSEGPEFARGPLPMDARLRKAVEKLGHPSLIGCGPARIGGEIRFIPDHQGVTRAHINANSGRYTHARRDVTQGRLDNVRAEFRKRGVNLLPPP